MVAHLSLLVRPGSPDVPEFVDIECSGVNPDKSIQFLVNGIVRATVDVDTEGSVSFSFTVPVGEIQDALADLNFCADVFTLSEDVSCRVKTGTGDSMELRYAP